MTKPLSAYGRALRQCARCHQQFAPEGWESARASDVALCRDCAAADRLAAMQRQFDAIAACRNCGIDHPYAMKTRVNREDRPVNAAETLAAIAEEN